MSIQTIAYIFGIILGVILLVQIFKVLAEWIEEVVIKLLLPLIVKLTIGVAVIAVLYFAFWPEKAQKTINEVINKEEQAIGNQGFQI